MRGLRAFRAVVARSKAAVAEGEAPSWKQTEGSLLTLARRPG